MDKVSEFLRNYIANGHDDRPSVVVKSRQGSRGEGGSFLRAGGGSWPRLHDQKRNYEMTTETIHRGRERRVLEPDAARGRLAAQLKTRVELRWIC